MNVHVRKAFLSLAILAFLAWSMAGCSRSQKFGSSISAKDIAKAMPEFILVMPSGATNLYFSHDVRSAFTTAYLKLTVPRVSLTNFLTLSGLNGYGALLSLPAGKMPQTLPQVFPLPSRLDVPGAFAWASDVRHAAAWDPYKGNQPLLMNCILTPAKLSPKAQACMLILIEDSQSAQAKVYLEYHRLPKIR